MSEKLVDIRNLSIGYTTKYGKLVHVLRDVNVQIAPGETLGLVGESGSGKSTLGQAMMGFLRSGSRVLNGEVYYDGHEMFSLSPKELESIRGRKIALIPQNAGQSLTPTIRIGKQIVEALELNANIKGAEAHDRAVELLGQVRLPTPPEIAMRYPHELSGGQQQRVAVAMALAGGPDMLVLDEPTTGLDVTTQAYLLELLSDVIKEMGTAMMYISHDLGVIARVSDRVCVMYAGEVVEENTARNIFKAPQHTYTQSLLDSIPRLNLDQIEVPDDAGAGSKSDIAIHLSDVEITYHKPGLLDRMLGVEEPPSTVSGINLDVKRGETVALVGESGSGKSTIVRTISGLIPAKSGEIRFEKFDLTTNVDHRPMGLRKRIQMIFQNPDASLNPRHSVTEILDQPLKLYFPGMSAEDREKRKLELLDRVRLPHIYLTRYPSQLSGGEKQRVAIARAFAAEPEIVLCDEVTSALDVSVQAAVLDLLRELQEEDNVTYIFITHDLAVVREFADRVAVLYQGRLCEVGTVEEIYSPPFHPYTQKLLSAVLEPDPDHVPVLMAEDAPLH
ncbi:MAG: ABC transporter ATP-binding protein [Chloroflexota bacterium]